MKKIYIYGAGNNGLNYFKSLDKNKYFVEGFIDTYKKGNFCGLKIEKIENILKLEFDEIHLANKNVETLIGIMNKNIDDKIVICNEVLLEKCIKNIDFNFKINLPLILTKAAMYEQPFHVNDININGYKMKFSKDYFRYSMFYLLSKEINRKKIGGVVAELGVYRGDSAEILNIIFKDKNLYLFDTFEGFSELDIKYENEFGYAKYEKFTDFSNTSIDFVLKRMKHPEKCIVKKGFFEDTSKDVDEKFSFVSIDCDLYKPVFEGLVFFYNRLLNGGYIMIHDYNSEKYIGVRKAVDDFEKKYGDLIKVPIPDFGGSLLIMK